MLGIEVVRYVYNREGKHPQKAKVLKILTWPLLNNRTELRGFVGICVYYRIWIPNFAVTADPLYGLLRKNVVWIWTSIHTRAMNDLKFALTNPPALTSLAA